MFLKSLRLKNHYNILGLEQTASIDEIKKAYRKLSMKFHPDKNDNDEYFSNMFKLITEAYDVLSDESKRRVYDRTLNENDQDGSQSGNGESGEIDPLFVEAAALFIVKRVASTSMLQTNFRIDFHRANALMAQLEKLGIVGAYKGSVRDVLVDKAYLETNYNYKFEETTTTKNSQSTYDNYSNPSVDQEYDNTIHHNRKTGRRQRKIFRLFLILFALGALAFYFKDELGDRLTEIDRTYFNENSLRGRVNPPNGLNMRRQASGRSALILRIPNDEVVLIIDENGPKETIGGVESKWFKVLYNNTEGWVWGGYITRE